MTNAPRVLVSGVCLGQPMGGVRRHNAELLPRVDERLRADGGGLAVLEGTTTIAFELPDSIERIASDVPYQPAPRRALYESRALGRALDAASRAGRPFDLVHTAHLPAPRSLAVPYTLTIHDLRSLDLDSAPFVRRLVGDRVVGGAIRGARRVLTVSEAMRERIREGFPGARGRVDVVGNGADHLPLQPREPADPPFLLHVGHVEPRKNLEQLVRALAVDASLPRVVLAGGAKGAELERLFELATELGVRGRIDARADVDDAGLAALYAAAACAVFPSRLEGFGIGPAEALRADCPTAVSDVPAHREVTGDAAERFALDDPDALVAAVARARSRRSKNVAVPRWDECADRWTAALVAATRTT